MIILWALGGFSSNAQIKILPREKVMNVANPRLALDSASFDFDSKLIVADKMNEDDEPRTFIYRFVNRGERRIDIARIVTTCSCLTTVSYPLTVESGAAGEVVLRYDPKGHPGRFERKAFVYSDDNGEPSAVLRLKVDVESGNDLSGIYPVQIGTIRLRRDHVVFKTGESAVEKIRFVNLSGSPLRLECEKSFLPDYISFEVRPSTVEDRQEGEIVISYTPGDEAFRSVVPVMLKGLGLPPSRSVINVKMEK